MFRKIVKFFERLKFKIHLKKHGISWIDFNQFVISNLTLENIKRRDFDFNTEIRSLFNLEHKSAGDLFNASKPE